jgi:molybdopterin molybdotransferase
MGKERQDSLGRGLPSAGLLPVAEARERIAGAVEPVSETQSVAIEQCLGRVLAADVMSPINVPAHTNSALDGFAIAGAEIPTDDVAVLKVIGTAWAGNPLDRGVAAGEAARIMTGAVMPDGTDTVVAQELVQWDEQTVHIGGEHRAGQNVRQAGEDLSVGEVAVSAGKRLMPAEMGLLASLGLAHAKVFRRLRVALFSTGDELHRPGDSTGAVGVYDSNHYTLTGLLSRLGAEVIDGGIIKDDKDSVRETLLGAAQASDVIITSGGVSTGEADYVEDVLNEHGELGFWRVAIRPGRPLAFGRLAGAAFFGLPGNPVAVMVTFHQLLQSALATMMGERDFTAAPIFKVKCSSSLRKRPGRMEVYRGVLSADASGELVVTKTKHQGSGVLRSMSEANCFIILEDECVSTEPGEHVDVQPFFALL